MKKRTIFILTITALVALTIVTNFSLAKIEEDSFVVQEHDEIEINNQPIETATPSELEVRLLQELDAYKPQALNDNENVQDTHSVETITIPEGNITIETEIHKTSD